MHRTPSKINWAAAALAAIASVVATHVSAHHSQQPFFHMDQNLEIEGVVLDFDFSNPHPIIHLEVTDAAGNTAAWQIEGPTAIYLSRTGWSADSLVPGERINVRGAPPKKADARIMAGREVRKSDGTVLRLYAEDARRVLTLEQ